MFWKERETETERQTDKRLYKSNGQTNKQTNKQTDKTLSLIRKRNINRRIDRPMLKSNCRQTEH